MKDYGASIAATDLRRDSSDMRIPISNSSGRSTDLTYSLRDTRTDDTDLLAIGRMRNLRLLDLSGTSVSDAGLLNLVPAENLQVIEVSNGKVTDAGISRFLARCPGCNVIKF